MESIILVKSNKLPKKSLSESQKVQHKKQLLIMENNRSISIESLRLDELA